jgi:hypothetical protein
MTAEGRPRRFHRGPANAPYRRVSPVAPRPREGPLTGPTAGAQPWPRERVLMPHSRHSPDAIRTGQKGGTRTFANPRAIQRGWTGSGR